MKAFLLAAGVGSRLGQLTAETPKCLLPIAGRPLIDYWIESFESAGVTDVMINLHHHADKVSDYLLSRPTNIRFVTFLEPILLGSAGTLREAWSFVEHEKEYLIVYADNFARIDLSRVIRFHRANGCPIITLVAYPTSTPERCGILELDSQGKVVSFEEKPKRPKSNLANAGIHVAGPELRNYLPARSPADLGFDVLPGLVGKMYGYVTEEYILDIGTPENYHRAQMDARAQMIQ